MGCFEGGVLQSGCGYLVASLHVCFNVGQKYLRTLSKTQQLQTVRWQQYLRALLTMQQLQTVWWQQYCYIVYRRVRVCIVKHITKDNVYLHLLQLLVYCYTTYRKVRMCIVKHITKVNVKL